MHHKLSFRFIVFVMILMGVVALDYTSQTAQAAVINVTTNNVNIAVDGDCSLIEAIINANDDLATHGDCVAGNLLDTINLIAGTYTINPAAAGDLFDLDGPTGLPPITNDVIIEGAGAIIERSAASPFLFRIFAVDSATSLTLNDLTVQNGEADGAVALNAGGGILNHGRLTLNNSSVFNNIASNGGGIYTSIIGEQLMLNNATIQRNFAIDAGGGLFIDAGITSIINDSDISANRASGVPSFGGGISTDSNFVEINNTTFNDNHAERGGAIRNTAKLVINDSTFNHNTGVFIGAGILNSGGPAELSINNTTIADSVLAAVSSNGAGIWNMNGMVTLTNSILTGNSAASVGGGVQNFLGVLTVNSSEISGNFGSSGGGINNNGGVVVLNNTLIAGNNSSEAGAGISNSLDLIINDSIITQNESADFGGGGISGFVSTSNIVINNSQINENIANGPGGVGGGIRNGGTLMIDNSQIDNNEANLAGGAIFTEGGVVDINASTFSNNKGAQAGAIGIRFATVSILDSDLSGNIAANEGGAIYSAVNALPANQLDIINSALFNNQAIDGGAIYQAGMAVTNITDTLIADNRVSNHGGGIYTEGGMDSLLFMQGSDVRGNLAGGDGGGIYTAGATTVVESTISENSAANLGGGVRSTSPGSFGLSLSTMVRNSATDGGGLHNLTVGGAINSTITHNTASNQGGGIFNVGAMDFSNVTINENSAVTGGGVFHIGNQFRIKNSIVANSPSGGDCVFGDGFMAVGDNLDTDATCAGFTFPATLPMLDALTNNGGPTDTHALLPGSPAIDAVTDCSDAAGLAGIITDQRSITRPQGAACDLGAYETEMDGLVSAPVPEIGIPCIINNDVVGIIPVRLGPDVNRSVAGFLPAVQNLQVIGQTDPDSDIVLHYLVPSDLFGPNSPFGQLWIPADRINPTGDCASVEIITPNEPQGQTTTFGGGDCGAFAATSPIEGFPQGNVTFFWNPAPGATEYQLTIRNLDASTTVFSQTVAAPTTSLTVDVSTSAIGVGFSFEFEVQAFINGQLICSHTVRILRESPPPDQPPPPPPQPMCGNGIQEPGENANTCPNGV